MALLVPADIQEVVVRTVCMHVWGGLWGWAMLHQEVAARGYEAVRLNLGQIICRAVARAASAGDAGASSTDMRGQATAAAKYQQRCLAGW